MSSSHPRTTRGLRVLISGAGVAGPTLAWFLARTGASITVVEKSPAILPHGQNVDIQGSARTVIAKMGLMDRVRRSHTAEKGTRVIGPTGRPIAHFPINGGASVSFTSELEILRGDLAALLHEATSNHPHVEYAFGTTVRRVVSNDAQRVEVELSDGQVREFDLLVAADGQWSKLRRQCFAEESVEVVETGMYAVYWTIPRLPSDDDWWNVYQALGSKIITVRPDPHGTIRAMFTCLPRTVARKKAWRAAAEGNRAMRAELLRSEFADAGWMAHRLLDAMDQAPDFYFQAIQQIKMSSWVQRRVVCLGDAAYAPTPLTGMGTSLAILGAYVLAGELARLHDGQHPAEALAAYEQAFRPFVEEAQKLPTLLAAVAHPDKAWQRALVQAALWTGSKVVANPWFSDRITQQRSDDFLLPAYAAFGEGCPS